MNRMVGWEQMSVGASFTVEEEIQNKILMFVLLSLSN